MSNLRFLKSPSKERSSKVNIKTPGPVSIVKKAFKKYLSPQQYEKVVHGYRRSDFSNEALIADFKRCDLPKFKFISTPSYERALKQTSKLFAPPQKYRPVHFADVRYYPFNLSSSAEAPFTTETKYAKVLQEAKQDGNIDSARLTFHNLYNHVFVRNRTEIHKIKHGQGKGTSFFYHTTAHARSHMVQAEKEDKIRMVFGCTKLLLQAEAMLLWPYFRFLREETTPIAWGYETMNGGLLRLEKDVANLPFKVGTILCFDWKMFDKRLLFSVINDVHKEWFSYIELEKGYIPTVTYPESCYSDSAKASINPKIANLFKWMSRAIKFTPIRLPDGSEYSFTFCSFASGSLQTQVLDSWVNSIMLLTILAEMGINIEEEVWFKVLGDDSYIVLKTVIPPEKFQEFKERFADLALQIFNALLNVDKSDIYESTYGSNFLGYTNVNSLPQRDELQLLAQLLYPERHWDINRLSARAIGIAYASMGQSELVYIVCRDVYEFCVQHGASPDPLGSRFLQYVNIFSDPIDFSSFPSKDELSAKLLSPYLKSEAIMNRYWDPSFFTAKY
jgi:hypothetical protein